MPAFIKFNALWENYPTIDEFDHDQLLDEIGWGDLKTNKNFENTCAIRMSLCLIRSGIFVPGRMKIKKPPYKNMLIEPGQVKLSNLLAKPNLFGPPERLKVAERDKVLAHRQGIISFMRIPGYVIDGALSGHIDLVKHGKFLFFFDTLKCAEKCYWGAQEYWFWPLP